MAHVTATGRRHSAFAGTEDGGHLRAVGRSGSGGGGGGGGGSSSAYSDAIGDKRQARCLQ